MANEYTRKWFEVFLDTIPADWTAAEVQGVIRRIPLPGYKRILDVSCGSGRHARHFLAAGYDVTGIDRDAVAIAAAQSAAPAARFLVLDQRKLWSLNEEFDAAVILWQSFGYFDSRTNDQVLADIACLLRPGGRLLFDLFHPEHFEHRQGRVSETRDGRCAAITNRLTGSRLSSTIEYVDGVEESMEWELFDPDELAARAATVGLIEIERCCWWEEGRLPSSSEQRYQLVLEKT